MAAIRACLSTDAVRGTGLATLWIDRDTLLRYLVTGRGLMHETTTSYEPSLEPIDVSSIERPDVQRITPQRE